MSPLESVTDYFVGLELRAAARDSARRRPQRSWDEIMNDPIVRRALARGRPLAMASRTRSAAAAPARPRWQLEPPPRQAKPRWRLSEAPEHVEIRSKSASPITIALSARSWRTLRDLARESSDGKETGGFFFGPHVRGWHRRADVRWVTRAIKDRALGSAKLDIGAVVAEKAELRQSGADGIDEQGFWHTHPDSRDGTPSPADLTVFLNAYDFLKRPYVGLILTTDGSDARWNNPTVHAWIVRRDGPLQRPVCEPALVTTN
jgi:hypothetical protein